MEKYEPRCESCGKKAKELFEKGNKWVCENCKTSGPTRGHITTTKPPTGMGRGRILDRTRGNLFFQTQRPDGKR